MNSMDNRERPVSPASPFQPHKIFSGVRWTGAGQVVLESVRLVVSIVLARLLSPADFGLAAMASVVTGFLVIIQYLGTGGVVIQRKELPNSLLSSLFVLNIVFGFVLALGLLCAAPALASFYNNTEVIPIIRVYAISFVITALGAVPGALMNRELEFGKLTRISFFSSGFNAATAVSMAFMGYGVWAIVVSSLVSAIVTTTLQWLSAGWRPRWHFDWSAVRPNLGMMANLTGMNVIQYFADGSDKLIIGKWLDEVRVGYYATACRFCLYPVLTIAPILTKVLYPAYSRLQDDNEGICKVLLRSAGGIAFIVFPLMVGLAILARPFVLAVLGDKWQPAIELIVLLAPVGVFQSIAAGSAGVLLAKNKSSWLLSLAIVRVTVTVSGILVGLNWGIRGVAIAYALSTILLTWTNYMIAFHLIKLSPLRLVISLRPYVVANIIMALLVYVSRLTFEAVGFGSWFVLMACTSIGVLAYVFMTLVLRPPALKDVVRILPINIQKRFQGFLDPLEK